MSASPTTSAMQGFRLSVEQEDLLRQGAAESGGSFTASGLCEITGPLDRRRLEAALTAVLERHEILRTRFPVLPGMSRPLQVIDEPGPVQLEWRDLSAVPAADQEKILTSLWNQAEGPRFLLVDLAAERNALFLRLPSLVADAASLEILAAEIARAYAGAPAGEPPLQYVDFAEWRHDLLSSDETREGRDYWRKHAPHPAPPLPWQRGTEASFSPRRFEIELPADLPRQAAALADRLGAGLPALLLTAWKAVLGRSLGAAAPAVHHLAPGRKFAELAQVVGPLARHLPLEAPPASGQSFTEAVRALACQLAEQNQWEEHYARPAEAPAPRYAFTFLPQATRHEAGEVRLELQRRTARLAQATVELEAVARPTGFQAVLVYDAGDLDEATAGLLAHRFATLLEAAVAHPDTELAGLPVLGPTESAQITLWGEGPTARNEGRGALSPEGRNGGTEDPERSEPTPKIDFEPLPPRAPHGRSLTSLSDLWSAAVSSFPTLTAIESAEGEALTYADLDSWTEALAATLTAAGVGLDDRVAVCLERSPAQVAAFLAVLKAGAAYVPLDPAYPAERLTLMFEDAHPKALLVAPGGAPPALTGGKGVPTLSVSREVPAPPARPTVRIPPEAAAYVIYTSGSTGRPKGVVIPHRAITNRILWTLAAYPMGPGDAVLYKTPASFDASVWEIFGPLFAGARLVVARPGGHQDPAYLAQAVAERGVTVLQLVPSMLAAFIEEEGITACRSLKRLFSGGEALSASLAERVFARLESVSLVNLYGPTECAIDVASWPCPCGASGVVPIGRPLDNVTIELLDRHGRPVPLGAPGELVAGGVAPARGYLGRPDLTAERFRPDPAGTEPGARVYRTGDLARFGPDGTLEFLGRADHQVKIRGFRIELPEIEAALLEHPAVGRAAVTVVGEGAERHLVAYTEPREAAPAGADELAAFLHVKLPPFMVPAIWVPLAALPLLPNGKIDRQALPEPDGAAPGAARPEDGRLATPTEEIVAGIWAEVLGTAPSRLDDNFFTLGGHSLSATRVISLLRRAFRVDVRIQALFEAPTVAGLAREVDRELAAGTPGGGLALLPMERRPEGTEAPLSFAQQRLWFLEQLAPGTALFNIPDAVRLKGPLDPALLARALAGVVARHESLRASFPTVRGEARQVIAPPFVPELPLADLSALPEAAREREAGRLLTEEGDRPFDLARGPLLRALLLRLAPEEHHAAFTVQHIVSDAWSAGVLVGEVGRLYAAFAAGEPSPLPELPLQYGDFAAWQRQALSGEVLAAEIEHWRGRLAGAPVRLDLLEAAPRPSHPTRRGATLPVALDAELSRALATLARKEGVTLFMALLAAFGVLLRHLSGRDDLVIGTDIANRTRAETFGLIGFFINQLALRLDLAGDPTFRDLLVQAREVTLGAYAHQDLPFDLLVDALGIERSVELPPLFQVKLSVENTPAGGASFPGLTVERLPVTLNMAKLDLTLQLWESPSGLSGWLNYSTELFDERFAARFAKAFEALLAEAVARPEARLSELADLLARLKRQERAAEAKKLRAGFPSLEPAAAVGMGEVGP